jgi:hypothetical protein
MPLSARGYGISSAPCIPHPATTDRRNPGGRDLRLACKTDQIDAWVLAELARRDLVRAVWLPTRSCVPSAYTRWRPDPVRHRSSLKQRVHAVLLTHGKHCPVSGLFVCVAGSYRLGSTSHSPGKACSKRACG